MTSVFFGECSSLTSIILPAGVTKIVDYAFSGCSSLNSIILPTGVAYIGKYAFSRCSSLTSIILPEGVTYIGSYAFSECTSLESIVIPEGVESLDGTFSNCSSLKQVYLPNSLRKIGRVLFNNEDALGTFEGCASLTSIILPNGLFELASRSFYHCTSLRSVILPTSIAFRFGSMDNNNYKVFSYCPNLKEVIALSKLPPDVLYDTAVTEQFLRSAISSSEVFSDDVANYSILYVPAGSKDAYEKGKWDTFKEIKEGISFSLEGGTSEAIEVGNIGSYDIVCDGDWLSFNKGRESFTITARANDTYDVRATVIRVIPAGKDTAVFTFLVSQDVVSSGWTNAHEWVNLGLPSGLLWATCNVGASTPEEFGDYFAWGETEPKDGYDWSTYKWCDGNSSSLTKYNDSRYDGIVDNKRVLELSDDAAYVNWGDSWHMPTKEDWIELMSFCNLRFTSQNGESGCRIESKSNNGVFIFLPATGFYTGFYNERSEYCWPFYWSSSLYGLYSSNSAWIPPLYLDYFDGNYLLRDYGCTVRPVCRP